MNPLKHCVPILPPLSSSWLSGSAWPSLGDTNYDSTVDPSDLAILANHWLTTTDWQAAIASEASQAPEPTPCVILMGALLWFVSWLGRRGQPSPRQDWVWSG